jgi:two-component system, OmpR family, response regulator
VRERVKPRILCIEDDEETCEMLTVALQPSGYEVVSAHTSTEGLRKALTDGFDAILMDSYLSDGLGIELCKKIRGFNRTISVIFYSGEARPDRIEQVLQAGAQAYLINPIDPFEVEKTIKRLLGL